MLSERFHVYGVHARVHIRDIVATAFRVDRSIRLVVRVLRKTHEHLRNQKENETFNHSLPLSIRIVVKEQLPKERSKRELILGQGNIAQ